jgi:hypothetical protein
VKVSCSNASLRSPKNPFIRIEPANDCDGSECDRTMPDREENLGVLPPHFHLIEWEPEAGFRRYAVAGDLPEGIYESSH